MGSEANVVATAESVEGPYYGNGGPERSDIRDGRAGVEFELNLEARDLATGKPIADLKLDLWHPDAQGYYSGYEFDPDSQPEDVVTKPPTNDEVFLRGAQATDADGRATFVSIYPGWYATRTTHIHLKVFKGDVCVLTTQLYLPESFSDALYASDPAYARNVEQDTRNAVDTVMALTPTPIDGCWVDVSREGDRVVGHAVLGIDLTAVSTPMSPPKEFRPPVGGIPHDKPVR